MAIAVNPVGKTIGAEIAGIDLRRPQGPAALRAVVDAINEHAVLVFRHDAPLTDDQQLAFGRALGPLQRIGMIPMLGKGATRLAHRELIDVSNLDERGEIFDPDDRRRRFQIGNRLWHTDVSFDTNRAVYSVLSARIVPPVSADTQFADMRAAYDALPAERHRELAGQVAEHSIWHSRAVSGLDTVTEAEKANRPPSRHTLVHAHPVSGRMALYLASHISHIVGWPASQSRRLLDELAAHATRPEFVYTHEWREGDVVMWDNLATMHRATDFDDLAHKRDMRRTTVLERATMG